MAFREQQIDPLDFDINSAVGVDIPFSGPAVFISNYQTKDAIKNNLINFFLTNPGERFLNPNFGGGLRAFIFEQISNNNLDFLKEDISSKISENFNNILVSNLDITSNEVNNSIKVFFQYQVINTNINDEINLTFE